VDDFRNINKPENGLKIERKLELMPNPIRFTHISSRFSSLVLAVSLALGSLGQLCISGSAQAAQVGEPAPTFQATDTTGQSRQLSDFKGKFVVLEWHNQGCPYVKKHYAGNMQKLQKEWTGKGVVWLTVISSAPGKQGAVTADQENAYLKEKGAAPTAVLLDSDGKVGKAYGAKTTPHMFVIDPQGKLVYNGAIDSKESTDVADIATSKNYVSAALTEAMAGKTVSTASTRPYGCGVKY
jgi:peroxiredoxin